MRRKMPFLVPAALFAAALAAAPPPAVADDGALRLAVRAVGAPPVLDDPAWAQAAPVELAPVPGGPAPAVRTSLRAAYDREHLYLRFECELPAALMEAGGRRTGGELKNRESLDVRLAPVSGQDIYYRFIGGLAPDDRYDAARGLITDFMHLLYGLEDPDWSGTWGYETRLELEKARWLAFFKIPFATFGTGSPEPGAAWEGNFGRTHAPATGRPARAAWSVTGPAGLEDFNAMRPLVFEVVPQP